MSRAERWRTVQIGGFERYMISDRGNVRGVTGRPLRLSYNAQGYVYVALHNGRARQKKAYVHRLVWQAFGGPLKPNHHIHHHNEFCDDNRIENLAQVHADVHLPAHNRGEVVEVAS